MKRKELIDEIDDELLIDILDSNKNIDNDCEFVYYYALPKIRILNKYIKRKYGYKNFISVYKNTKFLCLQITTVAGTKIFTYSATYSLNKNLNEAHIAFKKLFSNIDEEINNVKKIEYERINFITTTVNKLKKCQFFNKDKINIDLSRKEYTVYVKVYYGKFHLRCRIELFLFKKSELYNELIYQLRDDISIQSLRALKKDEPWNDFELKTLMKVLIWYADKPYIIKSKIVTRLIDCIKDSNIPDVYKDKVTALDLMIHLNED